MFSFLEPSDSIGDSSAVSTDMTINTSLGPIEVRIYGPLSLKQGSEPIICIPGMNKALVNEWSNVAQTLGDAGYTVVILNLFSNSLTKPKVISDNDFISMLRDDIIHNYFRSKKAIIMGKSWGGKMAGTFTLKNSDIVSKLVLIAPVDGINIIPKTIALSK